jgi:hypothetical protein
MEKQQKPWWSNEEDVSQIIFGSMLAQMIRAMVRLGITKYLADRPHTVAELAEVTGANPDSLLRFLRASVSVGLIQHLDQDRFAETPLTATIHRGKRAFADFLLAYTAPGMVHPWEELHNVVLHGQSYAKKALGIELWDYYRNNPEEASWFAGAMEYISDSVADSILSRCDFAGHKRIVDVGGSHGLLLSRILEVNPDATGVLFDMPDVVAQACDHIECRGLTGRIKCVGGSFLHEVPTGGDLYLVKNVLCDWDDENCEKVLTNCRTAARPGTRVIVVDWLYTEESSAMLNFTDLSLLVLNNGRTRTMEQYRALFDAAGLKLRSINASPDPSLPATVFETICT